MSLSSLIKRHAENVALVFDTAVLGLCLFQKVVVLFRDDDDDDDDDDDRRAAS